MDSLDIVDIDHDATFSMMHAAQSRGHEIWHYQVPNMRMQNVNGRSKVSCTAWPVAVRYERGNHFTLGDPVDLDLSEDLDVVLMRQHLPFDMCYITASHMLDHIHPGTLVINDPRGVRNAPEKLLVTHFADLMPPTLVAWDITEIKKFRDYHGDIIMKPLYLNQGEGILRIRADDQNFNSLLQMHFTSSREPLMFQRYEPSVRHGDKRIILIDGEPVGAFTRVPAGDEVRSHVILGGKPIKSELTLRDKEICERISPILHQEGLMLAGIDVIGDWLIEINVMCPSGLPTLSRLSGVDIPALMISAVEKKAAALAQGEG